MKNESIRVKKTEKGRKEKDLSAIYNAFKKFEGKLYTGAKVGREQFNMLSQIIDKFCHHLYPEDVIGNTF